MEIKQNQYRDIVLSILVIGMFFWLYKQDSILIGGFVFALCGLMFSFIREINTWFWEKLSAVLQTIFQPIIAGIVFFIVLVPIGLLKQLFTKKQKTKNSTFKDVNQTYNSSFFEKQW